MDMLHESLDKLFTEVDHLERLLDKDDIHDAEVALALPVAKRVRRTVTLVLRELAARRDETTTTDLGGHK